MPNVHFLSIFLWLASKYRRVREMLNHDFVFLVFIFASGLAVILKLQKWISQKRAAAPWLTKLQLKYFICYYTFMSGLNMQGPYVYQRYLDNGLDSGSIGIIMSTFNIVSALWGFAVGYFTELLGHKKLILISALLLSVHASLRYIGGFWSFVAASACMGVATASNRVVFEDWLMAQLQAAEATDQAHATIQENSALIRLLTTLALTPVSARLTSLFGSSSAFCASSLMFMVAAFVISIVMDDTKIERRKRIGFMGSFVAVKSAIWNSRNLALLLLGDFAYNAFLLLYNPRWLSIHQVDKKEKLPLSQMSSASSVALMNGAQLFGAVLNFLSAKWSLALGFSIYTVAVVGILLFFNDKNMVFLCFIIASVCDGGVNTAMRIVRGSVYPSDVRGYILGLLRVPTSLCVSGLLMALKGHDVRFTIMTALAFLILSTAVSFIVRVPPRQSSK